jgi:general secretion pathway protein G
LREVLLEWLASIARKTSENMNRACANQKGFTLLELIVVAAIIGLLVSLVGPKLTGQLSKGERETAKAQLATLAKSIETLRIDLGRYPTAEEGFKALFAAPTGMQSRWRGPYLQSELGKDPWGHNYAYQVKDEGQEFVVVSLGKDGRPGGTGDNEDIVR